jgi:MFS family permease
VSGTRLRGLQKLLVGLVGTARGASNGMLATALVVFVGRDGSLFAVSMLATVFHFGAMVFSPLWGAIGDATGRRHILLVAISAATTATAFAFAVVDGVWGLIGLRAVYSAFVAGFAALVFSVVGALGGPERRGRATGFFKSATAVGNMGSKVVIGVLLGLLARSQVFLVVGVLGLFATAALVPVDDPLASTAESPTLRSILAEVRSRLLPDAAERARLRETGLSWLYAGLALRHVAVKGVGSLVPIYLLGEVGVSEVLMGVLLALGPAAQIVLNPYFGRLVDRSDRKRIIVLGIAASGAYGLVLAAASLPSSSGARIALAASSFFFIAAGFSAMDIGVIAFIGDSVPQTHESEFVGLRATVSGIGGVLGPTLVGVTAAMAGYRVAFALVSALAFLGAALAHRRLDEPERETPPSERFRGFESGAGLARPPGHHRGDGGEDGPR